MATFVEDKIKKLLPLVNEVLATMQLAPQTDMASIRSAGMSAITEAVAKFDPQHGGTLEGFTRRTIRFRIHDQIRREAPMSRRGFGYFKQIKMATEKLQSDLKRNPTDAEVAEAIGVTTAELEIMRKKAEVIEVMSLDAPQGHNEEGKERDWHGVIPDISSFIGDIEVEDLYKHLDTCITMMKEDSKRFVLRETFFKKRPLMDVANEMGVTESRVCQIRNDAILELRHRLVAHVRKDGDPKFTITAGKPVFETNRRDQFEKYVPPPEIPETGTPVHAVSMPTMNNERIFWTEDEVSSVVEAFIQERLKDFFSNTLAILARVQTHLPEGRRRICPTYNAYGKEFDRLVRARLVIVQPVLLRALDPSVKVEAAQPNTAPTMQPDPANEVAGPAAAPVPPPPPKEVVREIIVHKDRPVAEVLAETSTGTLIGIALDRILGNPKAAEAAAILKHTVSVTAPQAHPKVEVTVRRRSVLIYGTTAGERVELDHTLKKGAFPKLDVTCLAYDHQPANIGVADYVIMINALDAATFKEAIRAKVAPHRLFSLKTSSDLLKQLSDLNSRQ